MITPSDSPSSPEHFAEVTPHGRGPAPYDIQAALPQAEVTAAFDRAVAEGGAGVLYPVSPRIAQARQLLESPQGFGLGGFDVDAGASEGWPNNIEPGG